MWKKVYCGISKVSAWISRQIYIEKTRLSRERVIFFYFLIYFCRKFENQKFMNKYLQMTTLLRELLKIRVQCIKSLNLLLFSFLLFSFSPFSLFAQLTITTPNTGTGVLYTLLDWIEKIKPYYKINSQRHSFYFFIYRNCYLWHQNPNYFTFTSFS